LRRRALGKLARSTDDAATVAKLTMRPWLSTIS
jgi:hypothetical protein